MEGVIYSTSLYIGWFSLHAFASPTIYAFHIVIAILRHIKNVHCFHFADPSYFYEAHVYNKRICTYRLGTKLEKTGSCWPNYSIGVQKHHQRTYCACEEAVMDVHNSEGQSIVIHK